MLFSIVRIVEPGALCSHPVGRYEVSFFAPYAVCEHTYLTAKTVEMYRKGRTVDEARQAAHELAGVFNRCCYVAGVRYGVEEIAHDESPDRAPPTESAKYLTTLPD